MTGGGQATTHTDTMLADNANPNGLTIAYSSNRAKPQVNSNSSGLVLKENKNIVNEDLIYHTPATDYSSLLNNQCDSNNSPSQPNPVSNHAASAHTNRQSELVPEPASPYYVNDIKNLIRLPMSLSSMSMEPSRMTSSATTSTMTAGSVTAPNEYMNCDQIDPALIHLAQQLSGGRPTTTNNNLSPSAGGKIKSLFSSYSIASSSGNYFKMSSSKNGNAESKKNGERVIAPRSVLNSSSSSLNYIIPERVGMNEQNVNHLEAAVAKKSSLKKNNGEKKTKSFVNNENVRLDFALDPAAENRSEYCVMDPKKTTATTKASCDMSKQRRLEQARLN